MLPKKNLIFIFLILILSFLLRIYKLDQIPNSISADEASFGYNAYSILKTGKDEFGITFPLLFRSFDDYKNPLFVYTLVPFILMFGLTEWAIRFPSVILGILVVITSFFITRLLIKNNKLSLLTAFFAATSPWLIQYSRVSIDTIIALNFLILGVLFYLLRKKHGFWLLLSSLALALSFWSYHSSRIWAVGFVILTSLYSLFLEKERRKIVLVSVIIFILLCLPYIYISQKTNTYTRLSGISVFADKEDLYQEAYFLKEDLEKGNLLGKLIHNRRLVPLNQAINGYLNILNPQILFSQNKHNQIAQTRLLFLWQAPLIVIGLIYLGKTRVKLLFFLLFWIGLGLLPGAITIYPPFDRRILTISYPLILLTILGLRKTIFYPLFFLVFLISFTFYTHHYFIHGQNTVVELWGNGMRQVIEETKKEKTNYDKVIVSLKLNQPLIFFLFYEKYPPQKYLQEGGTVSGGYLDERGKFEKYQFRNITPQTYALNTLYVWNTGENLPCLKPLKTINQSDGKPLARIGHYDPLGCK